MAFVVPKNVLVFTGNGEDGFGATCGVSRRADGFEVRVDTHYPPDGGDDDDPMVFHPVRRCAPSFIRFFRNWEECAVSVRCCIARYGNNTTAEVIRVPAEVRTVLKSGSIDEILREGNLDL